MTPCAHSRRLSVDAKCNDMCSMLFPNGRETDGYVIRGIGLGGGDYVKFEVCIDCKVILGLASAEEILAIGEAT